MSKLSDNAKTLLQSSIERLMQSKRNVTYLKVLGIVDEVLLLLNELKNTEETSTPSIGEQLLTVAKGLFGDAKQVFLSSDENIIFVQQTVANEFKAHRVYEDPLLLFSIIVGYRISVLVLDEDDEELLKNPTLNQLQYFYNAYSSEDVKKFFDSVVLEAYRRYETDVAALVTVAPFKKEE
jgi:hypothetical protein